ncbi:MAG: cupin domain-containing protein [Thermodesulfobacteriota bacterium]
MKIFKVDDYVKLDNPTPGKIHRREILNGDDLASELGGIFGIIVAGSKGEYHYHNRRESLLLIISGEAAEYVEGVEHPIRAGDVLFIRPGEKHTIVNHSDSDLRFLEFFTHPPVAADKISAE